MASNRLGHKCVAADLHHSTYISLSTSGAGTLNVLCTLFSPGETLSVAENRLEYGTNLYYAESRGRET